MAEPAATEGSRGLILFADDERMVRASVGGLLTRHGFRCLEAGTGEEALALLRTEEFDAMISDIHMPGNVGLELIESVPQIAAGLPVILLTGRPTVETAARSVRLAVAAYLTKPPDFEELCRILDDVIARHRGYRAMRSSRARLQQFDQELAAIETLLRQGGPSAGEPMAGFLRVSLQQVMLLLADLAQATALLEQRGPGRAALEQVDFVAALRRTVDVLERTKRHFKSKDLADLRKELEQLLARTGEAAPPPPGPPSTPAKPGGEPASG